MPLHDWSNLSGWEGMHPLWMAELLRRLKGDLPASYRAYLGSGPALSVCAPPSRADVSVRTHSDAYPGPPTIATAEAEPDEEIAVALLETSPSLLVEQAGRLVAAVELISPRNKDRPSPVPPTRRGTPVT